MNEKLVREVTLIATSTLALIIFSVVVAMLLGLFNEKVDNQKIFEIIGPSFQGIVGAMIGLVAGINISVSRSNDE